jgi:F-type H+-transporting ATPase subunit a
MEPRRDERTPAERRMADSLGPEMASDAVQAAGAVATPPRSTLRWIVIAALAIAAFQLAAFFVFPPHAIEDPAAGFQFPNDAILANFELPAPHVAIDLTPDSPPSRELVTFDLTISSSLLTGWIVMALIALVGWLLARGISVSPRGPQNALEYVYEGLANFATSLGGPGARRYVPIFVALFLFILIGNWSGLFPGVGRVPQLRAPTSDVNVTIGLALFAFLLFHVEGVRALGVGGYLGKFFSLRAFREEGLGAGMIALFVGVIEFLLEFVKPVTLAMRLFGNIYGGEVALGVITGLTLGLTFLFAPTLMILLEVLLNFMQALIFAVLTLMFTIIAIERHDSHEEHAAHGNVAPDLARPSAAAAH